MASWEETFKMMYRRADDQFSVTKIAGWGLLAAAIVQRAALMGINVLD